MTYSASSDQKKNDKHINSEQHHDILSQLRQKIKDEQINSEQHHDILSQLRPEEKRQTYKQWTTK
jgi:hypothetical protein